MSKSPSLLVEVREVWNCGGRTCIAGRYARDRIGHIQKVTFCGPSLALQHPISVVRLTMNPIRNPILLDNITFGCYCRHGRREHTAGPEGPHRRQHRSIGSLAANPERLVSQHALELYGAISTRNFSAAQRV